MGKTKASRRHRSTSTQTKGHPFSLLIKPASGECNLRCDYCFYLEKCDLFPSSEPRRMSEETLTAMLTSYFSTPQPNYAFAWQGGEPTLMGLDFFKRVVELQRELAPAGAQITNAIQTNGTLITDAFAEFLAKNRFLVGISIDGPAEIHDRYRLAVSGGATHANVLRGLDKLKAAGAEVNALTVVNDINVSQARTVYQYLKDDLGLRWHQYIPLVELDQKGARLPFTITGEQWGRFLNDLFDSWYPDDTRRVSIRHFDSVLQLLAHGTYAQCTMAGSCSSYVVVEHNGEIYPCDFYVEPELRLGKVDKNGLAAARRTPQEARFAAQKSRWPEECARCPYLMLCSGDCPRMRLDDGRSLLCDGWKAFYARNLDTFRSLAQTVPGYNGGVDRLMWETDPDAPCFCGSGKRFGNCHGAQKRDTL